MNARWGQHWENSNNKISIANQRGLNWKVSVGCLNQTLFNINLIWNHGDF